MKEYLEPDYSSEEVPFDRSDAEEDDPAELEYPDDDQDDDSKVEEIVRESETFNKNKMANSPFGTAPQWGQPAQRDPWNNGNNLNNNNNSSMPWQKPGATPYTWQYPGQQQGQQGGQDQPQPGQLFQGPTQAVPISRPKSTVIINLFDGIVESLSSNGVPGQLPRGTWDIRFRLEVWARVASFSPSWVFALIPEIGYDNYNNVSNPVFLDIAEYSIHALQEYLTSCGLSIELCKYLSAEKIGTPRDKLIDFAVKNFTIDKRSAVYIGNHSGYFGYSNQDLLAAKHNEIDYADINQLIRGDI